MRAGRALHTADPMKAGSLLLAAIFVVAIGAPLAALAGGKSMPQMTSATTPLPIEGRAPSFGGAIEWLNSPPLTAADLRGKVVLIDFAEAGHAGGTAQLASIDARGAEVAADWDNLRSPESYVGYERTQSFASPGRVVLDKQHAYTIPARLRLNQWALSGDWTMTKQATVLNKANGRIAYRFHARDLHLVMGPAARGSAVRFRVLIDGQPPGPAHGFDVDAEGYGTVSEQRLYQLIRQPPPIVERQFEIELLDAGVEAFVFTFG